MPRVATLADFPELQAIRDLDPSSRKTLCLKEVCTLITVATSHLQSAFGACVTSFEAVQEEVNSALERLSFILIHLAKEFPFPPGLFPGFLPLPELPPCVIEQKQQKQQKQKQKRTLEEAPLCQRKRTKIGPEELEEDYEQYYSDTTDSQSTVLVGDMSPSPSLMADESPLVVSRRYGEEKKQRDAQKGQDGQPFGFEQLDYKSLPVADQQDILTKKIALLLETHGALDVDFSRQQLYRETTKKEKEEKEEKEKVLKKNSPKQNPKQNPDLHLFVYSVKYKPEPGDKERMKTFLEEIKKEYTLDLSYHSEAQVLLGEKVKLFHFHLPKAAKVARVNDKIYHVCVPETRDAFFRHPKAGVTILDKLKSKVFYSAKGNVYFCPTSGLPGDDRSIDNEEIAYQPRFIHAVVTRTKMKRKKRSVIVSYGGDSKLGIYTPRNWAEFCLAQNL